MQNWAFKNVFKLEACLSIVHFYDKKKSRCPWCNFNYLENIFCATNLRSWKILNSFLCCIMYLDQTKIKCLNKLFCKQRIWMQLLKDFCPIVHGIASGRRCLTSAVTFLCVLMLVIAWADGLHIDMNFRFSISKSQELIFFSNEI